MIPIRVLVVIATFILFYWFVRQPAYSKDSARVVSIFWAIMVSIFAILNVLSNKEVRFEVLFSCGRSILVVAGVFYALQILNKTYFWIVAWPVGFFVVLYFA